MLDGIQHQTTLDAPAKAVKPHKSACGSDNADPSGHSAMNANKGGTAVDTAPF